MQRDDALNSGNRSMLHYSFDATVTSRATAADLTICL
jgi:hypothetical protein